MTVAPVLIVAAFLAALAGAVGAVDLNGKASVLDGDTLEIAGDRVRLHGIDAPEKQQLCDAGATAWPCGANATRQLTGAINDAPLSCHGRRRDRCGRLIAVCYAHGRDLNAQMVREGWALAYRRYSLDYVGEESEARAAGRGVWKSQFVEPWEWRNAKRAGR